jgi:activator of HSP90 ATPase
MTSVDKLAGDCTILFSRGKKRLGYDIACILNFTAKLAEGASISGTLEFPEIADSVASDPWQVLIAIKDQTAANRNQGEMVYDAYKASIPKIRAVIDAWVEELKLQE